MPWTRDFTKGQKRELRRIAGLAHEREITVALTALEEQFRRWRSGEIDAHDLTQAIHAFHQGSNRELWVRYAGGDPYLSAGSAISRGIVAEHEVAADVLEIIKPLLDFARANDEAAQLGEQLAGPAASPKK